ncbi:MAG: cell division protein SepF [Marmoricola sp.]
MSGTMRKMGVYLGLLEDGPDSYGADYPDHDPSYDEPARRETPRRDVAQNHAQRDDAQVANLADHRRTNPTPSSVVAPMSRITTLHPRTYNEARVIGENFRDGVPVIMNLSEMSDGDAKRLVDFAAGLVFAVRGSIERVTNKVFLLSPPNVSVAAEDKQRIAEGGFFNQS